MDLSFIPKAIEKGQNFLLSQFPENEIRCYTTGSSQTWDALVIGHETSQKMTWVRSHPNELSQGITQTQQKPVCIDFKEYAKAFTNYQEAIGAGEIEKAILSRVKEINMSNFELSQLFAQLCSVYKNACVHLMHLNGDIWLGASPEILFSSKHQVVTCTSLAGTLPANTPDPWTSKEIREQAIVTDWIQNTIQQHGKLVETIGPQDKVAGKVKHLETLVSGQVEQLNSFIENLHPTPAIGGYPKQNAEKIIQNHEPHQREWYTGYLRFKDDHSDIAFVNLRCMKIIGSKAYLFLGGGITSDSVLEKEWEETELKAKTLLSVMQNL